MTLTGPAARGERSRGVSVAIGVGAVLLALPHGLLLVLMLLSFSGGASGALATIGLAGFWVYTAGILAIWYAAYLRSGARRGRRRYRPIINAPSDVIREGIQCAQCGYDLRGLRAGARCPDCGHGIMETLRAPTRKRVKPFWSWPVLVVLGIGAIPLVMGLVPEVVRKVPPYSGLYGVCWREQAELLFSGAIYVCGALLGGALIKFLRERDLTVRRALPLLPAVAGTTLGMTLVLPYHALLIGTGRAPERFMIYGLIAACTGAGLGFLLLLLIQIAAPAPGRRWLPLACYVLLVGLACGGWVALGFSL